MTSLSPHSRSGRLEMDSRHLTLLAVIVRVYRIVIVCVVYGCETWSVILWEEHRLRVFENRVLREVFGVNPYPANVENMLSS